MSSITLRAMLTGRDDGAVGDESESGKVARLLERDLSMTRLRALPAWRHVLTTDPKECPPAPTIPVQTRAGVNWLLARRIRSARPYSTRRRQAGQLRLVRLGSAG